MTHMIELADTDIKSNYKYIPHSIFCIFSKVIERLTMVSSNMKDILKDPNKASRVKTIMCEIKNTTDVINSNILMIKF